MYGEHQSVDCAVTFLSKLAIATLCLVSLCAVGIKGGMFEAMLDLLLGLFSLMGRTLVIDAWIIFNIVFALKKELPSLARLIPVNLLLLGSLFYFELLAMVVQIVVVELLLVGVGWLGVLATVWLHDTWLMYIL